MEEPSLLLRRRCFGLGSKVEVAFLPDGSCTRWFQQWRVSFDGDIKVLRCVTKQSLLRHGIWERLAEVVKPRTLFEAGSYLLEYHFPWAPFPVRVEVDDCQQLAKAYESFARLAKRKRPVLRLLPRCPGMPLFDITRTVPKGLGLQSRAALVRYLATRYASGRGTDDSLPTVTIEQLDAVMRMKLNDLKFTALAAMPSHERQDHAHYLGQGSQSSSKKYQKITETPEQRYLKDDIDLQTYADLKYPDFKAKRDRDQATYPLPEKKTPPNHCCVICRHPQRQATIKCMECQSRACVDCINTNKDAFLLMHHVFCLQLADAPPSSSSRRRHQLSNNDQAPS